MNGLVTANENAQKDLCGFARRLQDKGIIVRGVFPVAGKLAVEFEEGEGREAILSTKGVFDLETETKCPVH